MTTHDDRDLLEQLTADHTALRARFGELAGTPLDDHARRRERADAASAALVEHLAAEEEHLYPLVRRSRPRGDTAVDDALAAHAALQALVRELSRARAGSTDFDRLLTVLAKEATRHFAQEEALLFEAVRGDLSDHTLDALGDSARRTEAATSSTPPRSSRSGALPPDRPLRDGILGSGPSSPGT
ncbi:hypothetical protein GCM10010441_02400 [Kitasatospora paracochleata]|uniref:Hemerythrin-like domain-containing protein n=1 Tax=Kitasatospora paracochleata TaxID=58354 RepID=A0ABT1J3J8_9ACTN|nr:hemerythrin domain-containing protein [Kitasatospora paracochleata]MCP2311641.1 hemerythrin-like domain-containing protein [Kitasatospora paracochleata]